MVSRPRDQVTFFNILQKDRDNAFKSIMALIARSRSRAYPPFFFAFCFASIHSLTKKDLVIFFSMIFSLLNIGICTYLKWDTIEVLFLPQVPPV